MQFGCLQNPPLARTRWGFGYRLRYFVATSVVGRSSSRTQEIDIDRVLSVGGANEGTSP